MYRNFLLFLVIVSVPSSVLCQQGTTPVIVSEARKIPFDDRIEALGTLKANESVVLTAAVTETVTGVHFEDGQRVEAGQILIEMTNAEEHAQLEEVQFRVEEAKRQLNRVRPLTKSGSAPASLADERNREYETAKAQLRAIESRLADRLVKAPFDGVIGLRNISVGSLVSPGDKIATLDDDNVMKLDFSVPSTFLSELRKGMPITAKARAFAAQQFSGEVSSIDSRVDPVSRSIIIRALVPNENQILKPGLLMSVELIKNRRQAVVLPEEALMKEGNKNFVFVVEEKNGKRFAAQREVKIGSRRPGEVEIVSGVTEGDLVVTHGTFTVRPGGEVSITAREQGNKSLHEMLSGDKGKQ